MKSGKKADKRDSPVLITKRWHQMGTRSFKTPNKVITWCVVKLVLIAQRT